MKQFLLFSLMVISLNAFAERKPTEKEQSFVLAKPISIIPNGRICLSNLHGAVSCDVSLYEATQMDKTSELFCFVENRLDKQLIIAEGTTVSVSRKNSYRASFSFSPQLDGYVEISCDAKERNPLNQFWNGNRRYAKVNEILKVFKKYNESLGSEAASPAQE